VGNSRNDIIQMALNGDLAKAIQFASAAGNGLDLSSSTICQQLQQIGLQGLQAMQQTGNASNEVSTCSQQQDTNIVAPFMQENRASLENPTSVPLSLDSSETQSAASDDKQAQRTIMVPCQARGVSMEHNFQVDMIMFCWGQASLDCHNLL
jgi:hypothetical protein